MRSVRSTASPPATSPPIARFCCGSTRRSVARALGERATEPDRLEREDERFFAQVAAAYDELARAEPARIRTLDAGQAPAEVLRDALAAIEDLL